MIILNMYFENLFPCPRNRSHRNANNMSIKTELARLFEKDLNKRLIEYNELRDEFLLKQSRAKGLVAEAIFYTPDFFTAKGEVCLTAIDFDAHKIFWDVIHKWLGINDGANTDVTIRRRPSKNVCHHVSLRYRFTSDFTDPLE